jgi:hypothetical protein
MDGRMKAQIIFLLSVFPEDQHAPWRSLMSLYMFIISANNPTNSNPDNGRTACSEMGPECSPVIPRQKADIVLTNLHRYMRTRDSAEINGMFAGLFPSLGLLAIPVPPYARQRRSKMSAH